MKKVFIMSLVLITLMNVGCTNTNDDMKVNKAPNYKVKTLDKLEYISKMKDVSSNIKDLCNENEEKLMKEMETYEYTDYRSSYEYVLIMNEIFRNKHLAEELSKIKPINETDIKLHEEVIYNLEQNIESNKKLIDYGKQSYDIMFSDNSLDKDSEEIEEMRYKAGELAEQYSKKAVESFNLIINNLD